MTTALFPGRGVALWPVVAPFKVTDITFLCLRAST